MWLPSIEKLHVPPWLRQSDPRLRMAVFVLAGLACLNLLLYVIFVAPAVGRLKTDEARLRELRRLHAEAVFFKKHRESFTGIISGIPAQKDMPLLVKEFVQTVRRLRLSKYDIPRRASGELAMLTFSFPVTGRYPDIKRFIYELETSNRLVGIQTLKLDADQARVKLDMKLVTYVKGR